MNRALKSVLSISALSACAIAPVLMFGSGASAIPVMDDTYVGAGVTGSATSSNRPGDSDQFGGNITGRFAVPNIPVSARGTVIFNDSSSAVVPTLTYDMGVARNTNVFVGAGAAFVQNQGKGTPIGNQNSAVVTAGVESKVSDNLILYGDTKVGIGAYQNSSTPSVTFSAGAGLRF